MANPGGVGTKFVSVNLNKFYGQPSHHQRPSYSSSYGQAAASRGRPSSSHGSGMVVLSRPRSSQKVGTKLSVPPPLNLPSLRKEHEKYDLSGSGGGSVGGAASGSGSRPTSSGMGWTKPGTITLQEDGSGDAFGRSGIDAKDGIDQSLQAVDSVTRGSSVYVPPSAQLGGIGVPVSASARAYPSPVERAAVLRGEDFPSLKAALPTTSGPVQKQKDSLHQNQKLVVGEESLNEQRDSSHSSSNFHMRPQGQASNHPVRNGFSQNAGEGHGFGSSHKTDQARKQEDYFPGPLPLVRVNPRSDWADDERDTSHGFTDRNREHGFSKSEAYWDREFDLPKSSFLPHKPPHPFDRWSQRDDGTGKVSSSEVPKLDPYRRDVRTPIREVNSWKSPSVGDGFSPQEVVNDKNGLGARPNGLSGENKYVPPPFGSNVLDAALTVNQDSARGRRDMGYGQEGKQQTSHMLESLSSRGAEWNTRNRYGSEQPNRFRRGSFQNNSASRSSFSSGGKGLPMNPMLNFGKEKRAFARNERPYSEDPFLKDLGGTGFDEGVPFSGGLFGVIKRKKDVVKQADLHDPVRESFEAELERVQKMQEQERRRIIEEQEKALEQARREEEERQQLIREDEEQRRRMEEEAREAVWRAEQGRLEAIQKAEEQRIAREEEKQRLSREEERRKQAAKQKLLELEARIAKRQAEGAKGDSSAAVADEKMSDMLKENDISGAVDVDSWEDNERTVERITISASYNSSGPDRPFEMSSRPHYTRDGSSGSLDRGNHVNSCRRDVFETGNCLPFLIQDQDNSHISPRQDASISGRVFHTKEFYGGAGYMSSRTYFEGGMQEPHIDDFPHLKGPRWNASGGADPYSRNTEIDSEFHENLSEKYNDIGLGQGRSRSNARSPYPERLYPSSEADELYSYGRSRYSTRQPRVLPPPSIASMHKTSFRGDNDRPGPSTFFGNNMHYNHKARTESTMQTGFYGGHPEMHKPFENVDVQQETTITEQQKPDKDTTTRCDSQSSLSVSSLSDSPNPLSHDDLDEIGSAAAERKEIPLSRDESVVLNAKSGEDTLMIASSSVSTGDDEEWAIENNGELQEQEEYDEDGDGYQEEDEVHEGDYENPDLIQEFKDMHLVKKGTSNMMDNLVLGFDEGYEVGIPSDEFESNSRNEENTFGVHSVGIEEHVPVDGMAGDGQNLQAVNDSPQVSIDGSSTRIQDSSVQAIDNAPHTSLASDLLDRVSGSSSSGLSAQHALPSPVHMPSQSSSIQTVMSTVPAAPSEADLPFTLQFGMFSGPSLISSPVPAIQIGSIQMPLHLHPPVGSSLSHIHPSQPSLFQFGQLRYTSPISQGIPPMAPQSMSFVQPNTHAHYNLNQKSGVPLPIQPNQDNSIHNMTKDDVQSHTVGDQHAVVSRTLNYSHETGKKNLSHENASRGSISVRDSAVTTAMIHKTRAGIPQAGDNKFRSEPGFITEDKGDHQTVVNNYKQSSNGRGSEGQSQTGQVSSQSFSSGKDSRSKAHGPLSDVKGKTSSYSFRNSGPRSSFQVSEASRTDSSVFQKRPRRTIQRTEFRVRENVDRRQSSGLVSSDNLGLNDQSNFNGRGVGSFVRSGSKKNVVSSKPLKLTVESECSSSGAMISQEIRSGSRANKGVGKEALAENQSILHAGEGNLKQDICPEEDVDAPLESGVVRIFKQPGIEVHSDEDDFVQVRSKRQVLNDRREQREKEIKEKSRVTKTQRRPRSTKQSTAVSTHSNKTSASFAGEAPVHPDFVVSEQGLANLEVSTGFTSMVSQPLSAIGTSSGNTDTQADRKSNTVKSLPSNSISSISNGGKSLGPDLIFDTENKVLGNFQTSLGSWGNERINQQVMALTQTQLDEAMKPIRFDAHVASIGDRTSSVSEPIMPSSSILMKDKSFSSTASPIDSLLAGEKIQFGAVTSPTVLPPSSRVVSHGIGPPRSGLSDIQITHDLSAAENDCTLFFEKDKHSNESCVHIEDREAEAEAEAAASAVAVAAISCDENIGNESSVSVSDAKSCGGAVIVGITGGGVACDQLLPSQSRAEESLSVALPADLSVETSPISLWPPLPSPQNSLSRMLSHFPGGPTSHYPIFDMNPMLGGPIFAFSPCDESAGTQSQSQKSTASVSGHLGNWQQGHSGVDSFYGPPAGFTGPFISPPGGIPGVQGPPHMVVYNHFAPVGQFGQVGLSFVGTTYIPSGKQPDWKHNVTSSAMGIGEGDVQNMNVVSAQHDTSNMPAPVSHLAPGSSLLPMPSPLAMFDVSPFQSAPDMSAQGRWSHVPASPLHSIPVSLPSRQQAEGVLPSQFSHGHPMDQLLTANRFSDSRTSTPSDSNQSFPVATDATVTQFPDGLGLDSLGSAAAGMSTQSAINKGSSSGSNKADVGKTGVGLNCSSNNGKSHSTNDFRTESSQQKNPASQQYGHYAGYNYHRGGGSQKNNLSGEWSQRRLGFHGRNQSNGSDKNFPVSKVKQVYVAKQPTSGASTVG
ncbi:uncharacterized protein LOC132266876 isoform X2 [Cornus florida]|uniref:uncharacterized protein LOC132266876 isoform X2 n=1 Tax=Cornus florida TaxID=4283 RepID=UPI0028A06187|nr:uncharacterized protein LOC132266876 isoform X2 [Cornus florida]